MPQRQATVFGGTGFLGSSVVRRLLASGWRVRVAARRAGPGAVVAGGEAIAADVTAAADVARAVSGVEAVVNALALYQERGSATFEAVHVDGAGALARAAHRAGVRRFVHVSGIGADPASPSRYVAARGRGEEAVRAAFPEAVILRPSVLFGPGDAFVSALEGVTRLPLVPLFGNGETRLQPVHVDDVAAAAVRVLELAQPPARVFELGGPEQLTYRDILARALARHGRRRPLLPVPFALWHLLAACCRVLPRPPLTRDQVILMQRDNVVGPEVAGFAALGIAPRALSAFLEQAHSDGC